MIKKRKLVFDKTTYVFKQFSTGGAAGAFTQTFHIYIDKEWTEYSLVATCIGYTDNASYRVYKGNRLVSAIGTNDMYLPFEILVDSIKVINRELNK